MKSQLPIESALPDLLAALKKAGMAVLEAPPGAGKTTRVPLAILEASLAPGRTVMLEPRRLATRAAAERLAEQLGESAGQTVGYRMRGETVVSDATRIEVVTEGILTRMIQSDPSLEGVGTVIFDEFHERSLNADLGLALCLESRDALRPDLQLIVMSATLDGAAVANLIGDAPLVRSEGIAFPVETIWQERPTPKGTRLEPSVAAAIEQAIAQTEGGVLVFLPGEGEIRRTANILAGKLPDSIALHSLFGAMPIAKQRAAIRPDKARRKLVLATSIAETSLTIEDVRVVIDAGLARRSQFDPGSAMARLVTQRVSIAEAQQRRGRAGRTAPGTCFRLWTKGEEASFAKYAPAEIETTDLTSFALDLAAWGAGSPDQMAFLTQPPGGAMASARRGLTSLGALDASGAITAHGRTLARMPLHPRLAHMLALAGGKAAPLAALLSDRDPLRGAGANLSLRLAVLAGMGDPRADASSVKRLSQEAKRLARFAGPATDMSPAQQAALAFPDRVALRRPGDAPRWVLSGGKGVTMDAADPLAAQRLLVVTDTDGHPTEARIRQAIALTESELRETLGDLIEWQEICVWSRRDGRVMARKQERLGSVTLADQVWPDAAPEQMALAMLEGIRQLGLTLTPKARLFVNRVQAVRASGADLPDMAEAALLEDLEGWLLPHINGVRTAEDWRNFDVTEALRARLSWDQLQQLDKAAPARFTTPLGNAVAIDYMDETPAIEVRLQEMFGTTRHPMVAGQPLKVTLLSPARRPVQTTMDLPGFWANSYADVRKDMRGRYPRHPWPEDPTTATPTLRAKPRK